MDFRKSKNKISKRVRKSKRNRVKHVSPATEISRTIHVSEEPEVESDSENVTGRFVCDECKKVLFSTKAVTIHKAKYHKKKKNSSDGKIIKYCEFCKKKIGLPATTENKSIDKVVCSKCRTSLYNSSIENLTVVVKTEDEKYSSECKDCGRWFDTWTGVTMHMRMHEQKNDIVKYVCDICDYECLNISDDFLDHFQIHGDKPVKGKDLKCEYCNKTFSKVDKYLKHIKTHPEFDASDRIILKCCQPLCNANFLKKDCFEKHQYMHQYINFECLSCHKYFKLARCHARHFKKCGATKI